MSRAREVTAAVVAVVDAAVDGRPEAKAAAAERLRSLLARSPIGDEEDMREIFDEVIRDIDERKARSP